MSMYFAIATRLVANSMLTAEILFSKQLLLGLEGCSMPKSRFSNTEENTISETFMTLKRMIGLKKNSQNTKKLYLPMPERNCNPSLKNYVIIRKLLAYDFQENFLISIMKKYGNGEGNTKVFRLKHLSMPQ